MIKISLCKDEMLTKEEVRDLIATNNRAVMKAVLLLYHQQTEEEKYKGCSIEYNNKGFSRYDSAELSAFAVSIEKHNGASIKDINKYRYRLLKYSQQIANIVNNKRDIQYQWEI